MAHPRMGRPISTPEKFAEAQIGAYNANVIKEYQRDREVWNKLISLDERLDNIEKALRRIETPD